MEFLRPTPEEAYQTLRAMKSVALADGRLDESERHLLRSIQRVLGTEHRVEEIPTVEPAELARVLQEQRVRRQLINGLFAMSMIDERTAPEERVLIQRIARALDVSEAEMQALERFVEGELEILGADALRRIWASGRLHGVWSDEALAKIVGALGGAPEDVRLAARYRALEHEAAGSLGRECWLYYDRNGFALPGEQGAGPAASVLHDWTHVLSGYGTDPEGEVLLACFRAGAQGQDPFSFVFLVLLQYHLGVGVPLSGPQSPSFGSDAALRAFERGAALQLDLAAWDYWGDAKEPLERLRVRYAIAPPAPRGAAPA